MIISIIGCTSLIATYLIENFYLDSQIQLKLFGRNKPAIDITTDRVRFFHFRHPHSSLPFGELLESDLIIYCAATGVQANDYSDERTTYEVNTFLPVNLLLFLNENKFTGKWISFGSCFEIGNNKDFKFFTEEEIIESHLFVPNSYCVSKRMLTKFLDSIQCSLKWFHLILPTIYGVKENQSRLIPYVVSSLKDGIIPKLSSGKQFRQYVHSSDLISLIDLLIKFEIPGGIYNIAGTDSIQIAKLVEIIFLKFNLELKGALGSISSRDEMMRVLLLDANKINTYLPLWKPKISLLDGIDEYIF